MTSTAYGLYRSFSQVRQENCHYNGCMAEQRGQRWIVWRRDDNGNEYEVARHDDKTAAEEMVAEFESRRHKQDYWCVPETPRR